MHLHSGYIEWLPNRAPASYPSHERRHSEEACSKTAARCSELGDTERKACLVLLRLYTALVATRGFLSTNRAKYARPIVAKASRERSLQERERPLREIPKARPMMARRGLARSRGRLRRDRAFPALGLGPQCQLRPTPDHMLRAAFRSLSLILEHGFKCVTMQTPSTWKGS